MIANTSLETPRASRQPVENNGTISLGINVSEGEIKDFVDMVEKLRECGMVRRLMGATFVLAVTREM